MAFWRAREQPEAAHWDSISWWKLDVEQAASLAVRWHNDATRRRQWLARQLLRNRIELRPSVDLFGVVWNWYLEWVENPTGVARETAPVWLLRSDRAHPAMTYTREQAIGGEAVLWFYVDTLRSFAPELSWSVHHLGSSKNEPVLVFPGHSKDPIMFGPMAAHHFARRAVARERAELVRLFDSDSATIARLRMQQPRPATSDTDVVLVYVEATDDPSYRWEVGIDDISAYEKEDLVAAFAVALGEVPGVSEADHQDREQILINGTVSKKALIAFANDWWGARVEKHRIDA